ncbi:MAG: hypothetical protein RL338_709 [Chloroflexota bacterium]
MSIAARPEPTDDAGDPGPGALERRLPVAAGLAIVLAILAVYAISNPARISPYDHFVRQAAAFLEGKAAITLPDPSSPDAPGNGYYQDAMPLYDAAGRPTGEALIPFPPLPALVLLPFVALLGEAVNGQWAATIAGALAVGVALRMLGWLPIDRRSRLLATVFLGLGTVLWYTSAIGTTWFLAHTIAVALVLLAIERALAAEAGPPGRGPLHRGQFVAGLLLGIAATARLPVILGAPFLALVGGGGSFIGRSLSAGIGAAIPIGGLFAYNLVSTGELFHPAYDYQYLREAFGYPELGYRPDWAIEDLRYIPQNLGVMFGSLPRILPDCAPGLERAFFSPECPWIVPDPIGMSLILTSPAWLLALPAIRIGGSPRLVLGAVAAVVAIAIVNLAHFSQGWVQFGYRFSNDFAPFALVLVALGIERLRTRWGRRGLVVAALLVGLSIAIQAWGVAWGMVLGW